MKNALSMLLIVSFIIAGCATTQNGVKRGSSSEIILEEIKECHAANVYELIQLLRPNMLFKASAQRSGNFYGTGYVVVYMDNVKIGDGLEVLKTMEATQISNIKYLRSQEATMRFGSNHTNGAFLLTSR